MTNEHIRIAIAESVGWTRIPGISPLDNKTPIDIWKNPKSKLQGSPPPNYCHDLNAMREAIQSMTGKERKAFVNVLWCVVNPDLATKWDEASLLAFSDYINATAHQRAEAYLRVKGLWKL